MKHMLVLEVEEKRVIEKASAIMKQYCNEMGDCEDCPFDGLCTKIHNSDEDLNVRVVFNKVKDIIC